jgi:hypothetical protein
MADFLLLMHDDAPGPVGEDAWGAYFQRLRAGSHLEGGSAIGAGVCLRKDAAAPAIAKHLTGYIRINADSLEHAQALVAGNPVYEAGGTVEVRELPRTG